MAVLRHRISTERRNDIVCTHCGHRIETYMDTWQDPTRNDAVIHTESADHLSVVDLMHEHGSECDNPHGLFDRWRSEPPLLETTPPPNNAPPLHKPRGVRNNPPHHTTQGPPHKHPIATQGHALTHKPPLNKTHPLEKGGHPMRLIRNLIDSFHIARAGMIVLDTTHDDSLYPMVLATGDVEVEREEVTVYPNAKAIINQDRSLTITRAGEIIGWHDTESYWRVSAH